jgi:hypothetical protein
VYRPFGAAYHGIDKPPPAEADATNSVGLQEAPGTEEKKSKFGKYGNTVGLHLIDTSRRGVDANDIIDGAFRRWWSWLWCW